MNEDCCSSKKVRWTRWTIVAVAIAAALVAAAIDGIR
jgi:hypothetical protein